MIAMRSNWSMIWRRSTAFDFKNFLRAGRLKNKFLTEIDVPFSPAQGSCFFVSLPSI